MLLELYKILLSIENNEVYMYIKKIRNSYKKKKNKSIYKI